MTEFRPVVEKMNGNNYCVLFRDIDRRYNECSCMELIKN